MVFRNRRLGPEQGNDLPFDNISSNQTVVHKSLGLSKAAAFWQYQSWWQAANLDKPNLQEAVEGLH